MLDKALTGRCQRNATTIARQERGAERILHATDAGTCRGQGKVRSLGAMRNAVRLGNMKEEPQIYQIETHAWPHLSSDFPQSSFETSTLRVTA